MLSGTIALLLGTVALYQLADLPGSLFLLLLWLVPWPLLCFPPVRRFALWLLLFTLGFTLAALDASRRLQPALDPALEGIPVEVIGVVDSLPRYEGPILRFELAVEEGRTLKGERIVLPQRLRLSWYNDFPSTMVPGQRWQLRVKLKRPWAMRNPGGFDYEQWLFQQGIRATGYVRQAGDNRLLAPVVAGYRLARLRHGLQQAIASALEDHPMRGLVTALAIGERSAITDEQWDVLLASGTNHLVAISGLHVGLVAGLIFLLVRRLWRLSSLCCHWLPAPRAASLLALLAGAAYAALAGFAIPTQRALVMLAVVLGALWWQRPLQRSRVLLLALWAVVLLDPVSVLSAGFWLSFAAVTWILYGMSGRLTAGGLWWRWGRVQFLVAAGLLPLLLLFFQQGSLSSPLANLIAVPWVSLLVVPLTLLGVVLLWWPPLGTALLGLAAQLLQWLWPLLQWLSETIPLLPGTAAGWTLLPALAGLVWLFAPHGWPLRPAGIVLLLPLLLWQPPLPQPGEARFTLLDVGQGLAAVVQTRHHLLVFDSGPRYRSGFDTGEAVVVPFLRERGLRQIDLLLISHGGNDHAGGARSVLGQLPVERMVSSIETLPGGNPAEPCRRGDGWQWDGVAFRILHPDDEALSGEHNDHSCVLRVDAGGDSLLITADIEAGAEQSLLASGEPLAADILVAPHHGSKSSSSPAFIAAVAPEHVLFSVGYRNRYGFPHPQVVQRYDAAGARLWRSDESGALSITLGAAQRHFEAYRPAHRRIWHAH
ncbi:MAG: DNA internalization-related competence protein ComEC/Rec2 [Gammaproteobacteria bacterium]|nr:DNA internalization-related competence protein ComEC/Rec2 [Gammaproteobacteria bacterium]MCW8928539.1 DNA internalization-related competence protein ComEC/Rec2 [Gammaproteobacteria bacterium]MCW8957592.1 DNA internalization-related competence protein ComEC/Rec2 [Gammaproteobacteria bacterium]MCW8973642.1 DNA internalization-related competence protein ComEC/Rec2 [Gammaproteobacteria bacterium]MCW8991670.1 DNA internalization-related competence protein ComEC/Rec2 [Gammaproteobacteria bacterium